MVRTQIQLTEEQANRLKKLAAERQESVSSLIRKAIDQFLVSGKPDRSSLYRRATSIVGKYEADKRDVSINHDRYLEEAFGE
ncbi:MAG TPA: ribbon-helix-helix protein, CopG family [Deltaproteobacteria bacterium]|nr:ribbon-helix-helix protein, CopG family [Deltaproteobacteria bacterium]